MIIRVGALLARVRRFSTEPDEGGFLLLRSGDYLLLRSGDKLLLRS